MKDSESTKPSDSFSESTKPSDNISESTKPSYNFLVMPSFNTILFILCLVFSFLAKMTIKGKTKQACAACKYQRRKCEKNCILARYFPPDQPQIFRNAHRLFGVSSIMRILSQVDEDKRDTAMSTIIQESNMRERYPVHGCLGVILKLDQELQASVNELRIVSAQLAVYKDRSRYQTPGETSSPLAVNIDDSIYDPDIGNLMMPQVAGNDFLVDQNDRQHQNPYYNNLYGVETKGSSNSETATRKKLKNIECASSKQFDTGKMMEKFDSYRDTAGGN